MNAEMPIPGIAEAEQLAASGKLVDAELAYVRAIYTSTSPEALNKYAGFLKRQGRLETALKNFEEAIQSSPAGTAAKAEAYRGTGDIFHQLHDFVRAQESYEAALAIDNVLNFEEGLARDYRSLGQLALDRGKLDAAETQFGRALRIDLDRGDQGGIAADKIGVGNALLNRGELERAEGMFNEALATSTKVELADKAGKAYLGLASVAERRADWMRAARLYAKAVDLLNWPGDLGEIVGAQLRQAVTYLRAGDSSYLDVAHNLLLQALSAYEKLDSLRGIAEASIYLAEVYRREPDFPEAERALLRAIKLYEKLADRGGLATAYRELGKLYGETGALDRARSMWAFARSLFVQNSDTSGAAEVERLLTPESKSA